MVGFIEGTLLISNVLLILFAIFYGMLTLKKEKTANAVVWIHYFIVACALFFLSELLSILDEFLYLDVGLFKAVLRISFGIVILFAFISEYTGTQQKKKKH